MRRNWVPTPGSRSPHPLQRKMDREIKIQNPRKEEEEDIQMRIDGKDVWELKPKCNEISNYAVAC